MDSGDGAAARTEGARLSGRREHPEGPPRDAEASGPAGAADPVRDRTRGQQQADFATIRRGQDRLAVFIATRGWSRTTYVEFVTDERLETLFGCHEWSGRPGRTGDRGRTG